MPRAMASAALIRNRRFVEGRAMVSSVLKAVARILRLYSAAESPVHSRSLSLTMLAAGFVAASLTSASPRAATIPGEKLRVLPMTMLWAWERPEHLQFLDATATGVAFLDRTISIDGS